MNKHKLIFIGPQPIFEAFNGMEETWDFQIPVSSVEEFDNEVNKEVSRIDENTSVIILFSRLFDSDPDLFSKTVAFYAPYSVVCILIPNADISKKILIEQSIKKAQYDLGQKGGYDINTPFYFVLYENPQQEIFFSINEYVNSPIIDEETKEGIRPMLQSLSTPIVSTEDEEDDFVVNKETIPEGKGQIIAVTSSKGGSGKSTVSIVLGSYIAKASKNAFSKGLVEKPLSVCIVDMDTRDGQLGFLTGKTKPTIIDMIENGLGSFEQLRKFIIYNENLECSLVLAAKRPRSATEISSEIYRQLISTLKANYDIVILDTSVNYLDPLLENVCYPMADKIILVSDMGISSVMGCSRWIKEVVMTNFDEKPIIPQEKVGVVINKALPNINMSEAKLEKAMSGFPILSLIPSLPTTILYAANSSALEKVLNVKALNDSFKEIAESIVDERLGTVPCN